MPIKVDQMGEQSLGSQVVKMIAILTELKAAYPRRVSASEIRDALAYASKITHTNVGCTPRNTQRLLVQFELAGLVVGDRRTPQGWRLTDDGKQFLGLIGG